MLNHTVLGPDESGEYRVVYSTPGCHVPTVAMVARTQFAAYQQAKRLNEVQIEREQALQADAISRGLYGVYPDLAE